MPTPTLTSRALILCVLTLGACATPKVTLKHPRSGQVVVCGGTATGSLLGGYIGHNVQKKEDADCVKTHEARGFRRQD